MIDEADMIMGDEEELEDDEMGDDEDDADMDDDDLALPEEDDEM